MEESGWIDVSVSLHSCTVHWPDNPSVKIERSDGAPSRTIPREI